MFDCPPDLPEDGVDNVEWRLQAKGAVFKKSNTIKFSRTWSIPVFNSTTKTQSSIVIPEHFLEQQDQAKLLAAEAAAVNFVQLKQQGQYLDVESVAGRAIGTTITGFIFGGIFGAVGVFSFIQGWWPGLIFIAIGVLVIFSSVFLIGRELDVRIDTQTRILMMRRKWFGIGLYNREVMLLEPTQFSIKKTSSSSSGSKVTEYYAVNIDNNGKKVLLVEAIKGKEVAEAVKNDIIERTFLTRYR